MVVGLGQIYSLAGIYGRATRTLLMSLLPALLFLRTTREEIYNILWALVFAFATLNILSLGARHFENERKGLTFGEILAITVVVVSIGMLGWEMLYLFKVFPLHLAPR
jgi:hypothetical protein